MALISGATRIAPLATSSIARWIFAGGCAAAVERQLARDDGLQRERDLGRELPTRPTRPPRRTLPMAVARAGGVADDFDRDVGAFAVGNSMIAADGVGLFAVDRVGRAEFCG